MKEIDPKFIEFKATDGFVLPGLLYKAPKPKAAAIFLHGNGSSSIFYNKDWNQIFAEALAKNNISSLYFNNRGANIIHKLTAHTKNKTTRAYFGMAHEKIKECAEDIDGAVAFLNNVGYKTLYLVGGSTGANKICVYDHYRPKNPISKYVLVSGGDDTGVYYQMLGRQKFWRVLHQSKKKLKTNKERDIIPELLPSMIFSSRGFFDIANPDGDYNVFPYFEKNKNVQLSTKPLFRYFKNLKKPTVAIYGELDEYVSGTAEKAISVLKSYRADIDYKLILGADHGYEGKRKELAITISNWLSKN